MAASKTDYTSANFQKFLDEQQYNKRGILRYEMIFGETYVSTGGQETTTKFCNDLELKVGGLRIKLISQGELAGFNRK